MHSLLPEGMLKMQKFITVFSMLLFIACSSPERAADQGKFTVLVSVVPQKYFVEQIAGDLVEVAVLIPPGASPAAYEISPHDMTIVSEANVWFTIGLEREGSWMEDFSSLNNDLLIVSTIEQIQRLPIERYGIPDELEENHSDHDMDHDHIGMDPHVWLSPELVALQAEEICSALSRVDPENSDIYSTNLYLFLAEISDLQNEIQELIDPCRGKSFMVFHPSWGYFADEYNLIQVPIEIAGGEPSPGEMARLVDFGLSASVEAVFVSPQFSESSAETIAEEINASVIFIDPLAENWADNLLYVAGQLAAAME